MSKQQEVVDLLQQGTVTIAVATAYATLPAVLKEQTHVILDIGYDLPVPIPDLMIDHHGISGTLSFSRRPFFVYVRWSDIVEYKLKHEPILSMPAPKPKKKMAAPKREIPKGWGVISGGKK
jgi:hypothetical protein